MKKRTLQEVLASLTLEEKASLLSGRDFWRTKPITEKGIPSMRMADGPHGVRREAPWAEKQNGGRSLPATCFPTESALACSWDTALCRRVGQALAQECVEQGVQVLLGPGVNIKRSPLCGRNFEYFSEDPLLAGKLAAAYIRGVEGWGVGTSLKHFALNNQENYRMRVSAEVDERTMRELYLKPFEIAVKEGRPGTVMASYNRVNGTHSTEHPVLLKKILREEWGFEGLVMTDWGALNDRVKAVRAGLDLEMPASGGETDRMIVQAVRQGRLREDEVDRCCLRVLHMVFHYLQAQHPTKRLSAKQKKALAKQAALESAVLMKNDGLLPLQEKDNIAVIGALANKMRFQGAGSSLVNAQGVSLLAAMRQNGRAYVNAAAGYHLNDPRPNDALERQALAYAKTANTVIYVMGLTEMFESEGYDRTHLRLPQNQVQLLEKLVKVNPNVAVVLIGGAPVEMPWLDSVRAVLYAGLGGEQVGAAVYDLLFGKENPSGKLAETWPLSLQDVPCAKYYPMGPRAVTHNEGIYVGYRYYDKAKKEVLFPFGYGLSYTKYTYSALECDLFPQEGGVMRVQFEVCNAGQREGSEIAQVYIGKRGSAVHRPVRALAGFQRVHLKPGERKRVCIEIPWSEFAVWETASHSFAVENGAYEICVGANSREILLKEFVYPDGRLLEATDAESAHGPYGEFSGNDFPDEAFYAVHQREPVSNEPLLPGEYTMQTTLGEMRASRAARNLERLAVQVSLRAIRFSTNPAVNRKVCKTAVRDLPFKNLAFNMGGVLSFDRLEQMLRVCNHEAGWQEVVAPKKHRRR